jgi:inorganic pyrophosphatase
MLRLLTRLPARDPKTGLLNAVVDTPRGSRNKYKFDEKTGCRRLGKLLPEGMAFPYDFGFISST